MPNIYYNINFPEILETTYTIDSETRERMVNSVLSQKDDIFKYHGGYTFHVTDTNGDFKNLYTHFLSIVNTMFGPLLLAARNKSWCWANVYNKDSFKTNVHNHVKTSAINAIYYLKIPKDVADNEAGLNIIKNGELFKEFIPEEDDLLIMPSNVYHEPRPHSSNDYRIAINMEICTDNDYSKYYTKEKIYATATVRL